MATPAWFDKMSTSAQKEYLRDHPNSKLKARKNRFSKEDRKKLASMRGPGRLFTSKEQRKIVKKLRKNSR